MARRRKTPLLAVWGRWALTPGGHLSLKGTIVRFLEKPRCSHPASQLGLLQSVLMFICVCVLLAQVSQGPCSEMWAWLSGSGVGLGPADVYFQPGEGFTVHSLTELL